ncbi:MAG: hypothetical protein ACRD1Q_10445 [Vicinamibacterales bacterium]
MAALRRLSWLLATVLLMLLMFTVGWVVAMTGIGATVDEASLTELERRFTEQMRGVALVGQFTIAGREDRTPDPDRYDISSVEKVGDDRWRFNTRVRYGNVDISLPITVPMRWVGDTPMIMMTDYTIPSMGTFSVRVFFYGDRYSGTWQHGKVGGHMFGRIEKQASGGS